MKSTLLSIIALLGLAAALPCQAEVHTFNNFTRPANAAGLTETFDFVPNEGWSGNLILNFNCLPIAARGSASLKVAHSTNLGAWTATANVVPDTTNAVPNNHVTFVVGAGPAGPPALKSVTATISSAAASGGKLFGHLEATQP